MTTPAPLPLATFRLSTDEVGRGKLEVNDVDLSDQVRRAALFVNPGELTSLQLELRGSGTIEGHGIVKVLLDDAQAEVPLSQAVLRFLDGIDPAELEQRALAGGMSDGPAAGFLAALKQIALQ